MAVKEPWNIYQGYPVNCACETGDTVVDSIENLGDKLANWTNVVGNSIEYSYYTGAAAGNPSGDTNNVETAKYYTGATLMFTQTFSYNANNNAIKIETT